MELKKYVFDEFDKAKEDEIIEWAKNLTCDDEVLKKIFGKRYRKI